MPIYLEDFDAPEMPEPFINALLAIGNATIGRPVTPGIAIDLLRKHLAPMLHEGLRPLFHEKGQPSWHSIHWLYGHLLFASDQGSELEMTSAAYVVEAVFRHSRRPARELRFPATPEVDSFERMARLAGRTLPARNCIIAAENIDLLRFCKYCWRPAWNSAAVVCVDHSAARQLEVKANAAGYKQAQRLRPAFEIRVGRIASKDEWEFHESDFKADVFFPMEGAFAWLRARRPHLFEALQRDQSAASDIERVVRYLYDGQVQTAEMTQRAILLTPVTLRAEAWLQALADKSRWGGARPGSGPKPTRCIDPIAGSFSVSASSPEF